VTREKKAIRANAVNKALRGKLFIQIVQEMEILQMLQDNKALKDR
jgi:hypothetical protein